MSNSEPASTESSSNPILWGKPFHLGSAVPLSNNSSHKSDFYQGSRLSNDGNYLLCSTDSNRLEFYNVSHSCVQHNSYYAVPQESPYDGFEPLKKVANLDVGEALYDFQPHATLYDQGGLPIVVTATKDHPIHIFAPSENRVLGSYIPINHLDELDFTLSVSFNITGDKIYSGSERKIRAFDIATAGRSCSEFMTCESKRSFFGQKGLISCITFNPDYSGLYAAGSFGGDVSVYAENSGSESFFNIIKLGYGINALKWSPCGRYLWVSGRNHPDITCWDVRYSKREVGHISRSISTNQRNRFDIDPWGEFLITGDDTGHLLCFSTKTFQCVHNHDTGNCSTINACHFHPFSAMVLATQGERTFNVDVLSCDGSGSEDSGDDSNSKQSISEKAEPHSESAATLEKESNINDNSIDVILKKRKAFLSSQIQNSFAKKSRKDSSSHTQRLQEQISSDSRVLLFSFEKLRLVADGTESNAAILEEVVSHSADEEKETVKAIVERCHTDTDANISSRKRTFSSLNSADSA